MSTQQLYAAELGGIQAGFDRANQSGADWVKQLRTRGLEQHRKQGIPMMSHEEWKYTSLRTIAGRTYTGAAGTATFQPTASTGSIVVAFVDGKFRADLSRLSSVDGVEIASLAEKLNGGDSFVEQHLGALAAIEEHPFAAAATALLEDGVLIHLRAGAMVEQVIELAFHTASDSAMVAPRVLIVAEKSSCAKIVETYTSASSQSITLPITEVFVAQDANIEHVRIQDESVESDHLGLWQVRQEQNSEYRSYNVCLGAKLGRVDQALWLGGRHVTTRLDGVVIAAGDQVLDNHSRLDHAVPDGNSFEIYKQIVKDDATVVFNGKIFVHQDAQKTDAKQTNQALLLSPGATINSKPQLEIFADDVKCTHGATVGSLEDLPLFYLRARGVPKAEAEALLVYAFAAEVIELISMDEVKDRIEDRLYSKLGIER